MKRLLFCAAILLLSGCTLAEVREAAATASEVIDEVVAPVADAFLPPPWSYIVYGVGGVLGLIGGKKVYTARRRAK